MEPQSKSEEAGVVGEMVFVRLSDVPEYLHNSELYRTFLQNKHDNNDETLLLPSKCFHNELSINNSSDLSDVLTTARYWMVDDLWDEVYDFATANAKAIDDVVINFCDSFAVLSTIQQLCKSLPSTWLEESAWYGDLQLMKYLRRRGHTWDNECSAAADGGQLECLMYAYQGGCSLGSGSNCACMAALEGGSIECFLYAQQNGCPKDFKIRHDMFEEHVNAECMEYVLSNSTLADLIADVYDMGLAAVALRSPRCIDKLCRLGWDISDDDSAYITALEHRDIATIEHVIRRGGCRYTADAFGILFEVGHRTNLEPATILAIVSMLLDCGKHFRIELLVKITAPEMKLEVVRTLIKRGAYPTGAETTAAITGLGCADVFNAALEYGCQLVAEVSQAPLGRGDVAMLKCAQEHGCAVSAPLIAAALMIAAKEGDAAKVQYLLQLLLSQAAGAAASGGHEGCVKLLQQHQRISDYP
jgi:hypothetical protein